MSAPVILLVGVLFLLAGIGVPIAYAILVGSMAYMLADGQSIGIVGKNLVDGIYQSFLLLAVPLFIVAANIMNAGTISDRLLRFCVAAVGRFRGGLGHVNVVASLIFSGMSGSAVADAAGIGKIIIEMMTKSGHYTRGYAAAITAASATIGPIIPPSIPMVLYALVSNTSIGALFLGGIAPGLLMGVVLMTMNWAISTATRLRGRRGGAAGRVAAADGQGVPGAPDAGDPALRHLWRGHDADRGGGRRRGLRADPRRRLLPGAERRARCGGSWSKARDPRPRSAW